MIHANITWRDVVAWRTAQWLRFNIPVDVRSHLQQAAMSILSSNLPALIHNVPVLAHTSTYRIGLAIMRFEDMHRASDIYQEFLASLFIDPVARAVSGCHEYDMHLRRQQGIVNAVAATHSAFLRWLRTVDRNSVLCLDAV